MGEGDVLWVPDDRFVEQTRLSSFQEWLRNERRVDFEGYYQMWSWSVDNLREFWSAVWEHFGLRSESHFTEVLDTERMPGAHWFRGATLNHAEHLLRGGPGDAIVFQREDGLTARMSWEQLRRQVDGLKGSLDEMGVGQGDRVAAWLPNCPEAVVSFLATASLGAVWSSCSSDFGHAGLVDRFAQISPKVLIAANGYTYNGKTYRKEEEVVKLRGALPSVKENIIVDYLKAGGVADGAVHWDEAIGGPPKKGFRQVPAEQPLWILFSSGTTGLPKPIVHSHAGILAEHTKTLALHNDLHPGDVFFWYTSTGWMMWNYLVGGLLHGSTIVLYDGSPSAHGLGTLWEMADRVGVTYFGTSAAFLSACYKGGLTPGENYDLSRIKGIGSTGSPLSPEIFEWVYAKVKQDVWLASMSGGTDVCTAFVGGCPTLPVKSGRIQCRFLGSKVDTFDEAGNPVRGKVGELVITAPMPSMPVYFWNDPDSSRYTESYFSTYPGVWRHGDWAVIYDDGTVVIFGRSDATIKRHGVRMGTSEIYRVVESIDFVEDSLAVDMEGLGGRPYMVLFVVVKGGGRLTEQMVGQVKGRLRNELSPRHVPDEVVQVPEVPRTLNGKKMEVPVKRILLGSAVKDVVNPASASNPHALEYFEKISREISARAARAV